MFAAFPKAKKKKNEEKIRFLFFFVASKSEDFSLIIFGDF